MKKRVATNIRRKEDAFFAPEELYVNRKAIYKGLARSGGALSAIIQ
jgi:hypothetical protein